MKRIIIILLVVVLCLAVVGCGADEDNREALDEEYERGYEAGYEAAKEDLLDEFRPAAESVSKAGSMLEEFDYWSVDDVYGKIDEAETIFNRYY